MPPPFVCSEAAYPDEAIRERRLINKRVTSDALPALEDPEQDYPGLLLADTSEDGDRLNRVKGPAIGGCSFTAADSSAISFSLPFFVHLSETLPTIAVLYSGIDLLLSLEFSL